MKQMEKITTFKTHLVPNVSFLILNNLLCGPVCFSRCFCLDHNLTCIVNIPASVGGRILVLHTRRMNICVAHYYPSPPHVAYLEDLFAGIVSKHDNLTENWTE